MNRSSTHTTTDGEIRLALRRLLRRRHVRSPAAKVVDEVGLRHGAARVDLMVIHLLLHGYEIKSDRDTLSRLPSQMTAFSAVLDRVTLIVGWKHVVAAMRLVPPWWSVSLVERGSRGGLRFVPIRVGAKNPTPEPHALVRLLWKDEVVDMLLRLGEKDARRAHRMPELYQRLVEAVPRYSTLRGMVCDQLKRRTGWRPVGRQE
jgi:hypothetical protein